MTEIVFTLDPSLSIQLILAVVLPLGVGLVTTRVTSGAKKAWLLALLGLLTSLVTQLGSAVATGAPFDLGLALLSTLGTFLISVGMYYGLWKPTGVAQKAQDVDATVVVE